MFMLGRLLGGASLKFTNVRSLMCMVVMKRPMASTFVLCFEDKGKASPSPAWPKSHSDS